MIGLVNKQYTIAPNGKKGKKVSLFPDCPFRLGDIVYQEILKDGSVLLIPERIALKRLKKEGRI